MTGLLRFFVMVRAEARKYLTRSMGAVCLILFSLAGPLVVAVSIARLRFTRATSDPVCAEAIDTYGLDIFHFADIAVELCSS